MGLFRGVLVGCLFGFVLVWFGCFFVCCFFVFFLEVCFICG